jgi:alkylation response protein AidB-like acyl-CoA dehydrogenase
MKPDLFQSPDYYNLDDLLTEEHKLVRDSARAWVKKEVSPIIEDYAQRAEFPKQIIKGLGEIMVLVLYSRRIWWCWFRPNIIRTNHARN